MKHKKKLIVIMAMLICLVMLFAAGCTNTPLADWDNLGGGGTGEIQDSTETPETDELSDKGTEILDNITEDQQDVGYIEQEGSLVAEALTISESGSYKISGEINGQIKVKAEAVKLFLDNCNIINVGKKVIDCNYSVMIVLMEGTQNIVSNIGEGADEANAISGSGDITVNGSGKLTILSTKSGIKGDAIFYGLGGELIISAGTGHGISADTCIIEGVSITVNGAAKDGIHAETDDAVLADNPVFSDARGYVYVGADSSINISDIYGDGIQADTYVLIDGGTVNIATVPDFVKATSSDSCYKLSGGVYSKVAAESSNNYSSLYQLKESCKGIKVGEIDYEISGVEYIITKNTGYSLIISGGEFDIKTTDDGLHTNSGNIFISGGIINIETSDDGVSADKNLKISGGNLTVSKSYEGLEGETIDITGGINKVTATDDGINASSDASTSVQKSTCYIKISGGVTYVNSSGDGVDSNGGLQISGGELYVYGPTSSMDASLDSETGVIINGGIVIAVGSSGMVETPATNSQQYCVSINLSSSASGKITVKSDDTQIASFSPLDIFGSSKNYQSIVISCPSFANGGKYSVISGSQTTSVTINGIITKVGNAAGPGGNRPR